MLSVCVVRELSVAKAFGVGIVMSVSLRMGLRRGGSRTGGGVSRNAPTSMGSVKVRRFLCWARALFASHLWRKHLTSS